MKKQVHCVQQGDRIIKLGIDKELFLTSYDKYINVLKTHMVRQYRDSLAPGAYIAPDSEFYFRFPFPDEEDLPIENMDRTELYRDLTLNIEAAEFISEELFPEHISELGDYFREKLEKNKKATKQDSHHILEIEFQKVITDGSEGDVYLALVLNCPYSAKKLVVKSRKEMNVIIQQIWKHHILPSENIKDKLFWTSVARKILNGYTDRTTYDYEVFMAFCLA